MFSLDAVIYTHRMNLVLGGRHFTIAEDEEIILFAKPKFLLVSLRARHFGNVSVCQRQSYNVINLPN